MGSSELLSRKTLFKLQDELSDDDFAVTFATAHAVFIDEQRAANAQRRPEQKYVTLQRADPDSFRDRNIYKRLHRRHPVNGTLAQFTEPGVNDGLGEYGITKVDIYRPIITYYDLPRSEYEPRQLAATYAVLMMRRMHPTNLKFHKAVFGYWKAARKLEEVRHRTDPTLTEGTYDWIYQLGTRFHRGLQPGDEDGIPLDDLTVDAFRNLPLEEQLHDLAYIETAFQYLQPESSEQL